jgi:hypothetical protein
VHTASTARETLNFLWANYVKLGEQVDPGLMPPDILESHVQQNAPLRPFRIATWLTRLGFFISAWSLWEYYARSMCEGLPSKVKKMKRESTVNWVARSLAANNITFTDQDWFSSANSLRNLIAHNGGRIDNSRAKAMLAQSRVAFPEIEPWRDGYVNITDTDISELQVKIEEFIDEIAVAQSAFETPNQL